MKLAAVLLIVAIAAPVLAQQPAPSSSGIDWSKPVIVDAPILKTPTVDVFAAPIAIFTAEDLNKSSSPTATDFIRSLTVSPALICDSPKVGSDVQCSAPPKTPPASTTEQGKAYTPTPSN